MGDKEWAASDVFDVFGDELARQILVLASNRPVSADELANQLNVSQPTIYRRVNALLDYDLLSEQQQIDSGGNHYQTVETTLRKAVLEIEDGGYNVSLQMRQSLADQFESFWTGLDENRPDRGEAATDHANHQPSDGDPGHG